MNRTRKKLSWWWRVPAFVAIAMWVACPAICLTSSTMGGSCCPSEAKPPVTYAATDDHHHHDDDGHHHDHGDAHHHDEPANPVNKPAPSTDDACCTDSLLATTSNAPAKLLLIPDLKPVFGLDAILTEALYTLEHPTRLIDQSTPDRSWVFLLQEYCVLPSLPHGPPSLLLS